MPTRVLLVAVFATVIYSHTFAQIQAVTGTGDEVILYENHTWKYANKNDTATSEIQTNPKVFTKSPTATFEVVSNRVDNVRIYLNPKKWKFKKGEDGLTNEYVFTCNNKDIYGLLMGEKMQVPLETMREISVKNAMKAAPDVKVVKEEYRNVNGNTVLAVEMNCTVHGIPATFLNYYYSSESGTVQFDTWCGSNTFKENLPDIEEFLNGMVIINHK